MRVGDEKLTINKYTERHKSHGECYFNRACMHADPALFQSQSHNYHRFSRISLKFAHGIYIMLRTHLHKIFHPPTA